MNLYLIAIYGLKSIKPKQTLFNFCGQYRSFIHLSGTLFIQMWSIFIHIKVIIIRFAVDFYTFEGSFIHLWGIYTFEGKTHTKDIWLTSGNKNMPTTKVKHRVNLLEWVIWYNISLELYNYKRVKEKLLHNSVVVQELISPSKLALGKKQ